MVRLRNSTSIPDETVRRVVDWIAADLGIAGFDVECRNSEHHYGGKAYSSGSGYHSTARPFVVLRLGESSRDGWQSTHPSGAKYFSRLQRLARPAHEYGEPVKVSIRRYPFLLTPYQYGQHKGRKVPIASRLEMLVYLAAHELRHIWQSGGKKRTARRGYYHGSRGRFSEIDTEAYALHMLRQARLTELTKGE